MKTATEIVNTLYVDKAPKEPQKLTGLLGAVTPSFIAKAIFNRQVKKYALAMSKKSQMVEFLSYLEGIFSTHVDTAVTNSGDGVVKFASSKKHVHIQNRFDPNKGNFYYRIDDNPHSFISSSMSLCDDDGKVLVRGVKKRKSRAKEGNLLDCCQTVIREASDLKDYVYYRAGLSHSLSPTDHL